MKILNLKDNALFLQNGRERMRGPVVISTIVLAVIITGLIFLHCHDDRVMVYPTLVDQETGMLTPDTEGKRVTLPWLNNVFWELAIFQGIILLFFGTISADRMAIRERSSGTLDFHRSSPTSRFDQYIGLLFGTTSLEWSVFLGTLCPSFIIVLLTDISIFSFLKFYLSLILTALFFHSLTIMFAISTKRTGILTFRRIGALQLLIGFYFLSWIFFYIKLSSLHHLTWMPAYTQLMHEVRGFTDYSYYQWNANIFQTLYSLFGYQLPSLVIQGLAQVPLIIFAMIGIMRKISQPERPLLSKTQLAVLTFVFLFLFTASAYSLIFFGGGGYRYDNYNSTVGRVSWTFMAMVLLLGMVSAFATTPTRLMFEKGLRRLKKSGGKSPDPNADESSNVLWLFSFCFMTVITFFVLFYSTPVSLVNKIQVLGIMLCQVIFFASSLEYFRLSPHHQKVSLFVTFFGILWILLPIFGAISTHSMKPIYFVFTSASPFFNSDIISNTLAKETSWQRNRILTQLPICLTINGVLALTAFLLAFRERQLCTALILKNNNHK